MVPLAFSKHYDPNTHEAIAHGIMNIPALAIVSLLTLLLIRGTQESALVNGIIVISKSGHCYFIYYYRLEFY